MQDHFLLLLWNPGLQQPWLYPSLPTLLTRNHVFFQIFFLLSSKPTEGRGRAGAGQNKEISRDTEKGTGHPRRQKARVSCWALLPPSQSPHGKVGLVLASGSIELHRVAPWWALASSSTEPHFHKEHQEQCRDKALFQPISKVLAHQ